MYVVPLCICNKNDVVTKYLFIGDAGHWSELQINDK